MGGKICLLIALVCCGGRSGAAERDYCAEVIATWQRELPESIKSLPESKAKERHAAANAFVREGFRDFTAADLIAAARQCCEKDRKRGGYTRPQEPLVAGMGDAAGCLEMYPQRLEGADGIPPLLSIIADKRDSVCLQSFLISTLRTRNKSSDFNKYLNDYADAHREEIVRLLRAIADNVDESEVVRAEAEGVHQELRVETPSTGGKDRRE